MLKKQTIVFSRVGFEESIRDIIFSKYAIDTGVEMAYGWLQFGSTSGRKNVFW
jgi:hypothetical protein